MTLFTIYITILLSTIYPFTMLSFTEPVYGPLLSCCHC